MMLTGGIEADDGKNRPFGFAADAAVAGAALGGAVGELAVAAEGTDVAAATGESEDCGHSRAWCTM